MSRANFRSAGSGGLLLVFLLQGNTPAFADAKASPEAAIKAVVQIAHRPRGKDQPIATSEEDKADKTISRRISAEAATDLFAAKSWYVAPPPPPPPKPTAPPLPFSYAGMMDEKGKVAVFLKRGDRNYIIREGDQIDGQYRVDGIANGMIRLEYLPLHETQNLSIGNTK